MSLQKNLFGEDLYVGTTAEETSRVLTKFPAAASNPSLFLWLVLKQRCPWIYQLPENRQTELKAFIQDTESLRRRRQEWRENNEK
jgi:hypothetical protein